MRHHFLFGAALIVPALAACGGSSSETPPPLQPDPAGFRYAPASSRQVLDEADSGDQPPTNPDAAADSSANPRAPSGTAPAPR